MMNLMTPIAWPVKQREIHNHHMDSTVWNSFKFRDDDVIVATYGKSGTTWTQQIVAQLIFNGAEGVEVSKISPWVDLRIMPKEVIAGLEHQAHRRILKTHLPVDALVFSPEAKYIYIGRDGRDAAWSFFNHHSRATDDFFALFNNAPGWHGPKLERGTEDVCAFYRRWFDGDGEPYWSFWENIRSWWQVRRLPNVLLMHFSDMKRDLPGSVRRIADFLDIEVDEAVFPSIVHHCSFDYMKAHADKVAPLGGVLWQGGARTFVNKGINGRWHDTLSADEIATYEARALAELGSDCAWWLAMGDGATR
jgi:aryl sulfotransferase